MNGFSCAVEVDLRLCHMHDDENDEEKDDDDDNDAVVGAFEVMPHACL